MGKAFILNNFIKLNINAPSNSLKLAISARENYNVSGIRH
ncbi:hypothetical protein M2263_002950 [Providencia alcalifaciens]|nr:hypothetical protein [Providencia alcalifaciens]